MSASLSPFTSRLKTVFLELAGLGPVRARPADPEESDLEEVGPEEVDSQSAGPEADQEETDLGLAAPESTVLEPVGPEPAPLLGAQGNSKG